MPTPLQGGILLQTPLFGADGEVYAVAQGAVSIGGLSAGAAGGANVQVNHPTVGLVTSGALVEQEIESNVIREWKLNRIDFAFSRCHDRRENRGSRK